MEDGPLHSIHWFRIVLDEAHTVKAFRINTSKAVFMLTADRRWCLTGTPIQVTLVIYVCVLSWGHSLYIEFNLLIEYVVIKSLFICTSVFDFPFTKFIYSLLNKHALLAGGAEQAGRYF